MSKEYPLFVHHFLQVYRPSKSDLSARFGSLKVLLDEWEVKALATIDGPDAPCAQKNAAPSALVEVFGEPGRLTDKRRELACAALYNWLNTRPGIPTLRDDSHLSDQELPDTPHDVVSPDASSEPVQTVLVDQVTVESSVANTTSDNSNTSTPSEITLPEEAGNIFASIDDMFEAGQAESQQAAESDLTEDEAEIDQAISRSLTEPAYPLPPKPETPDIDSYQNDMMEWLATINKTS